MFDKIYRTHIRKEHIEDPDVPKAPIMLVEGSSGSGKSATVREALETVVFRNEVIPIVDWRRKKEEILADHSLFASLEDVDPEFAMKIARKRKLDFYRRLAAIPILRRIFRKRIINNLTHFEEQGIMVDASIITPNDYQTALSGEPGNYFKRAMGNPKFTSIRHIEEAHSAFGKSESSPGGRGIGKTAADPHRHHQYRSGRDHRRAAGLFSHCHLGPGPPIRFGHLPPVVERAASWTSPNTG